MIGLVEVSAQTIRVGDTVRQVTSGLTGVVTGRGMIGTNPVCVVSMNYYLRRHHDRLISVRDLVPA